MLGAVMWRAPCSYARHSATLKELQMIDLVVASTRAQLQTTRHNVEDLLPILTIPLLTLVSMAIVVHSGRIDLAGHALVASLLMTVGQMGFFVGSDIVAQERMNQTLELMVAAPSSYFTVLTTRIFVLTSLGLVGFGEAWLIARLVFGVRVTVQSPLVFAATLLATTFAATGTSVIMSALFSLARVTRTFQHAVNGPLYLLGGVLVPVTFLPSWLQPVSRAVFFYWSAGLIRDSFAVPSVAGVPLRLGAIVLLGALAGAVGAFVLRRMLDHLRREGTLGFL
jgi:ABC-2 type transport system permease protein